MAKFRRGLARIISLGSIPANIFWKGGMVATMAYLGYWAFPLYLFTDVAAAFLLVWLYGEPKARQMPWLARTLGVTSANLTHSSFWVRMLAISSLFLVGMVLGTLVSAGLIREVGFRGKSAYSLTSAITVPCSLLWTGIYYGFALAFQTYFV